MSYSARITEVSTLEGAIATTASIGSWFTDAIDLSVARRHIHEITIPTLSGGATVDYGVYTSATSGGTYAALAGASIAQVSAGNKVFVVEVATEFVTAATGNRWMKGYLKVATATATPTVTVRGFDPVFAPTTDTAAAAQTPIVIDG